MQGGGGSADELRHTADGQYAQVEHDEAASSAEPARAGQDGVVFVGGIVSQGVDPGMLEKAFEQHGEVASVQLVMRSAVKNRGFAYVHFRDPKDAAALLAASPDVFILGKKVDLRPAEGCVPGMTRSRKNLPSSSSSEKRRRRVRRLAPGVVRIEGFLDPEGQQKVADAVSQLGSRSLSGFCTPRFSDGRQMRLEMMCLGLFWDPEGRDYKDHIPRTPETMTQGEPQSPVPPIPEELLHLAEQAAGDAMKALSAAEAWPSAIAAQQPPITAAPMPSPNDAAAPTTVEHSDEVQFDVCIVNRYSEKGGLGMHRDCDERQETIAQGLPVVSLSLGATAVFEFVPPVDSNGDGSSGDGDRDPSSSSSPAPGAKREIHLKSGDAVVFGGPARLMPHGVRRILERSTPKHLHLEPRDCRLNLTFRRH